MIDADEVVVSWESVEDVTSDELLATVTAVLDRLTDDTWREGSDAVAAAINASRTPGITPFQLTGSPCGIAELLRRAHQAWSCRIYETVRASIETAEADRLLGEALELTWPSLRAPYGVPMASWSNDPASYRLMDLATLPPPHNLRRDCPSGERYHQLEQLALNPEQHSIWRRRGPIGIDPAAARRDAWNTFQGKLRDGTRQPCSLHVMSHQEWTDAVTLAVAMRDQYRPWVANTVFQQMLTARRVGEPLPPVERVTWSLLRDPITWDTRCLEVSNGQHRICGAIAAGLTQVLVRVI